jgi:hypothetical protein
MADVFTVLFFLALFGFVIGMVKPKWAIFWGKEESKTRKTVAKVYLLLLVVGTIGIGATNAPQAKTSAKETAAQAGPLSGEQNPYQAYKIAPVNSDGYKFWYINEYITGQYDAERKKLAEVLASHPDKIPMKKDGAHGKVVRTRTEDSGLYYRGELKDNRPNGRGMLYVEKNISGTSYIVPLSGGEFKDGVLEGYGRFYKYLDKDIDESVTAMHSEAQKRHQNITEDFVIQCMDWLAYEGQVKRGSAEGQGIAYQYVSKLTAALHQKEDHVGDLQIAIGTFKDGVPEGLGKLYAGGVLLFHGNLSKNEMNGKGTLYYPNGQIRYKGNFLHNQYDGQGILYKEDGSVEYEGKWSKGDYAS